MQVTRFQTDSVFNGVCDDACGLGSEPGMNSRMNTTFKSLMLSFALLMPVAGCDDDDGGDDTAGDSANDSGSDSGNDSGNDSGMTSSSEETCQSNHACINDACTCQTPGLEDMPCTDDEACVEECEICM